MGCAMNHLRLGDTLHRVPRMGAGLSSIWMVVLAIVLVQVLNDCFGWLENDNFRLSIGLVSGILAMIARRLIRGSRF